MLDLLNFLLDSVGAFFDFIYTFVTQGIYTFAVWVFTKFVEHATLAFLGFLNWALPFAWDVAKNIMLDLGLSAAISSAWSSVDSAALGILTAFRIPDCVNLLISSYFTKFVIRFIPFV